MELRKFLLVSSSVVARPKPRILLHVFAFTRWLRIPRLFWRSFDSAELLQLMNWSSSLRSVAEQCWHRILCDKDMQPCRKLSLFVAFTLVPFPLLFTKTSAAFWTMLMTAAPARLRRLSLFATTLSIVRCSKSSAPSTLFTSLVASFSTSNASISDVPNTRNTKIDNGKIKKINSEDKFWLAWDWTKMFRISVGQVDAHKFSKERWTQIEELNITFAFRFELSGKRPVACWKTIAHTDGHWLEWRWKQFEVGELNSLGLYRITKFNHEPNAIGARTQEIFVLVCKHRRSALSLKLLRIGLATD